MWFGTNSGKSYFENEMRIDGSQEKSVFVVDTDNLYLSR